MTGTSAKLQLQVVGVFRMLRSDDSACPPLGKRAGALMAMVALSPDMRRSRAWLQDMLWGSRGREQASASLRQALVEIRKALGADRDCLKSDNNCVALDPDRVAVSNFGTDAVASGMLPENSVLLEGLDIGEDGFEDWLREQRTNFRDRIRTGARASADGAAAAVSGVTLPNLMLIRRGGGADSASPLSDHVLDAIGNTVRELGIARVVDCRDPGAATPDGPPQAEGPHGLSFISETSELAGRRVTRLLLTDPATGELVWSALSHNDSKAFSASADELRDVNQAAMIAVERFLDKARSTIPVIERASTHCLAGVRYLFKLGKENFDRADACFSRAFELDQRGVYLAWRAYLRTFLLVERHVTSRKLVAEEAFSFLRRAIELDPHNSYVLALAAHVQSVVGRSYVGAFELAERATQLNAANPIAWACLGIAKCYLGRSADGFQNTLHARNIAGSAPFRYQLDALSCIAGTMAGRLDEAIHFGEASHAMAPNFAAPLRYLSALYFHQRDHAQTEQMIEKMRILEPDFGLDYLLEVDYPAAGIRRTPLLARLTRARF